MWNGCRDTQGKPEAAEATGIQRFGGAAGALHIHSLGGAVAIAARVQHSAGTALSPPVQSGTLHRASLRLGSKFKEPQRTCLEALHEVVQQAPCACTAWVPLLSSHALCICAALPSIVARSTLCPRPEIVLGASLSSVCTWWSSKLAAHWVVKTTTRAVLQ